MGPPVDDETLALLAGAPVRGDRARRDRGRRAGRATDALDRCLR